MQTTDNSYVTHRFEYHPPQNPETVTAHEKVRALASSLAEAFADDLPPGREQATAITKIEEAMFWANAAIARNQAEPANAEGATR